ncbi:hypothetical protein [Clostridium estertheticum]|uniref:hypothetical protein n=1 Tax=Clostridium estertheticum TaxID=238834 RepID=UPI001CF1EB00|nr:hypothetical protein [Clostridium estertheticum]MCB2342942.1 hypothetical protein [Clostridium estertheticum]
MKKRSILIILCLITLIILGTGTIVYKNYFPNIDSNNYLSSNDKSSEKSFGYKGNEKSGENTESFDFEDFNGKWSLMQFTSNKGTKITINDNTKISKGKFYIVILDSEYKIITKKNELNDSANINFTTPKDGKYAIRIVGKNARGKFNISTSSNIKVTHIDLFD